jgi:hypothetical protein
VHELPPTGSAFNERLMRWVWETVLDAPIAEPETVTRSPDDVAAFCGRYETVANIIDVEPHGDGISLEVIDRPELLEELGLDPEPEPPIPFVFFAGDSDRITCRTGAYKREQGILRSRRRPRGHGSQRIWTPLSADGLIATIASTMIGTLSGDGP